MCNTEAVVDQSLTQLIADCKALWAFYSTFDNKGTLDNDPDTAAWTIDVEPAAAWSDTNPIKNWYGVTVVDGRVTRLEIE